MNEIEFYPKPKCHKCKAEILNTISKIYLNSLICLHNMYLLFLKKLQKLLRKKFS